MPWRGLWALCAAHSMRGLWLGLRQGKEYWIADIQSAGEAGAHGAAVQDREPGGGGGASAAARWAPPRLSADAQEADLGTAQGGPRPAHQRYRGDDVYPRHRPQPAGALDCAYPRRPREGPAGCAVSRGARLARFGGRGQPEAGSLELWREARQNRGQVSRKSDSSQKKVR